MTEEWFTLENVETSLRSKKDINGLTEKRRPFNINVAKKVSERSG
jgi:hypothetical protein